MKKKICFYFQVHQPFRLRTYRFFDIGKKRDYFDDYANRKILIKVAEKCYLPTNQLLLELIEKHQGKFKICFSITGTLLDQLELYYPEVLKSFQRLAATGSVEFLAETYSHSLSALRPEKEFEHQVGLHRKKIKELFGQEPTIFRNTELIYSDLIGERVFKMGYKGILTEGAKHILGWKSPGYLYYNTLEPKMKLLLKNFRLSDDIAFRFSQKSWGDWPLTTEKFVNWLNQLDSKEEIVNLFMDYETFGEHQWAETGIFDFMRALPERVLKHSDYEFATPSEAVNTLQPVAGMSTPFPISWADEERDLTAWLGNDLQDDAFAALYALKPMIDRCTDPQIQRDWLYLQTSDHFYYMCTKFFSDGDVHMYFNHYSSPYEAYINYMNVLSDFSARLEKSVGKIAIPESKSKITPKTVKAKEAVKKKASAKPKAAAGKAKAAPKKTADKKASAVKKTLAKKAAKVAVKKVAPTKALPSKKKAAAKKPK